jgi:hypothetical protein
MKGTYISKMSPTRIAKFINGLLITLRKIPHTGICSKTIKKIHWDNLLNLTGAKSSFTKRFTTQTYQ